VVCLNCYLVANVPNSADENWGPLSDTTTSGTPYLENYTFNALLTPFYLLC